MSIIAVVAAAQTDEPSRGNVGILEIGVGDIRTQETGAAELGAVEVGALEDRNAQRDKFENGTRQICILEAPQALNTRRRS